MSSLVFLFYSLNNNLVRDPFQDVDRLGLPTSVRAGFLGSLILSLHVSLIEHHGLFFLRGGSLQSGWNLTPVTWRPGHRPDPTRPPTPACCTTLGTVAPAAPLAPGERSDRPTNVLTSIWVVARVSLSSRAPVAVDLHLLLAPLGEAHPWCPAVALYPDGRSRPAPSPPPHRHGEPPPLCAHAHAPNRDRHPGNRPGRKSRGFE